MADQPARGIALALSGGSLTNGFLAQTLDFNATKPACYEAEVMFGRTESELGGWPLLAIPGPERLTAFVRAEWCAASCL